MAVRRRRRARVHRRGRKSNARRATRRVRASNPRRKRTYRRRRRNWAVGGSVVPAMVGANPRRRRSRRRRNPVMHHRRRHSRRNPAILGFGIPPLKTMAFGVVGFAGPSFVTGLLNSTFPSVMSQITSLGTVGKYVTKIGSILGLAWLTRRFVGRAEASMVMIGGGINVAITAINDFAPTLLPNPFGTYIPTNFSAYVPTVGAGSQMSGIRGLRGGLAAARPIRSAAIMPTVGGTAGRNGAYGGVAQRFFRY